MRAMIPVALLLVGLSGLAGARSAATGGSVTGAISHPSATTFPTLVYVEGAAAGTITPPAAHTVIDQKGKLFSPHVLPVLVGTTVDFLNGDDFEHSVFSPDGEKYDLGKWGKGQKRSYVFKRPGVYTQLCNLHPEMIGYVVVLGSPHYALADQQGRFQIQGVPAGSWTLKVWNERLRPNQLQKAFQVSVAEGQNAKVDVAF